MSSSSENSSAYPFTHAAPGNSRAEPLTEPISFDAQLAYELGHVRKWREDPQAQAASDDIAVEQAISEAHQMGLVGVAFSGGGIRSATFNLGIIQALAKLKLLGPVDYLSTVSGGGYIGGWLSNLVHLEKLDQAEDPVQAVQNLLGSDPQERSTHRGAALPEPLELTWLRRYSNYLTPRTGLLSLDTLQGAAIYFRNVLLNQTALIALFCLVLLIPWCVAIMWGWVFASNNLLWSMLLIAAGATLIGSATLWLALRSPLVMSTSRGLFPNGRTALGIAGLYVVGSALLAGAVPPIWHGRSQWIAELPFTPSFDEPAATTALAVGLISVGCMIAYTLFWLVGWTIGVGRLAGKQLSLRTGVVSLLSALAAGLVFGLLLSIYASLFGNWSDDLSAGVSSFHATVLGTAAVSLVVLLTLAFQLGFAGADFLDILREWWGRLGGVIVRFNIVLLALAIAAIYSPYGVIVVQHWGAHWLATGGAVWVATTIGGVLSGASPRTGLTKEGATPWFDLVAKAAPYVFCAGLLVLISHGLYSLGHVTLAQHSAPICEPAHSSEPACVNSTGDRTVKRSVYEIYPGAEAGRSGGSPTEVIFEVRQANCCSFAAYAENFRKTFPRPALAPAQWLVALATMLGLVLAVLGRRVDVNQFSLHMFYRNRLERCYLSAGKVGKAYGQDGKNAASLTSDDFTNLDPSASPPLAILQQRPYPIINTALNAAHSNNLAWQERKAVSFTFTPKYCGYEYTDEKGNKVSAYRSTLDYGKKDFPHSPREALPLAMPITISGAAASPNGGFHTGPGTAFLMTMFNVRLGWWFANPLKDKENWENIGPKFGFLSLLSELLASSRDDLPQVYLSDGGHFENLGLYELVRRRCRYIIVCDADADPKFEFEDIGNAIRKIRIDLGIDIEIDTRSLVPDPQTGRSLFHCAVGKIHYGNVDRNANGLRELHGYLLYIKPSLTGVEPGDVLQYAAANRDFPNQTTLDQWFSESQFEAYRALGRHIGETVFKCDWDWVQRRAHDPEAKKSNCPTTIDEKIERLFVLLAKRWFTPSASIRAEFSKHGEAMNELFSRLSKDEDLQFLDGQFYPQWPDLMKAETSRPTEASPLPSDPKQLRKGFYFCNQIFQLMENVYLDLNLEAESDHPDNRGWMNIFHNWAWSPMLRVAWAISAASYGARFQTFCERKLGLKVGEVVLGEPLKLEDACSPQPEPATPLLNSAERTILAKLFDSFEELKLSGDTFEVVPLYLLVDNPLDATAGPVKSENKQEGEAPIFDCRFGFALIKNRKTLVFYRVQDHLRTVGLGTEGLRKLRQRKEYKDLELDGEVMKKIEKVLSDTSVEQLRAVWGASASPKRRAKGSL
jgi:hypothetical protein